MGCLKITISSIQWFISGFSWVKHGLRAREKKMLLFHLLKCSITRRLLLQNRKMEMKATFNTIFQCFGVGRKIVTIKRTRFLIRILFMLWVLWTHSKRIVLSLWRTLQSWKFNKTLFFRGFYWFTTTIYGEKKMKSDCKKPMENETKQKIREKLFWFNFKVDLTDVDLV